MAPTKKNGKTRAETPTEDSSAATVAEATNETPASAEAAAPSNGSPSTSAPAPSEYELLDDYAADAMKAVKNWVEENPTLAIAAAAAFGFVAGRLITALFPEPEPQSLTERVEVRARKLRKGAAHYADDAGEVLSHKLKVAADALSDAAETAALKAEAGYERSKDLADVVADAAKAAVAGAVAKKADSWLSRRK